MIKTFPAYAVVALITLLSLQSCTLPPADVGDSIKSITQQTLSNIAQSQNKEIKDIIVDGLKSKAITTTESAVNGKINDFVKTNTNGNTNISLRNLTSSNPSIRFISIQPISDLDKNSNEVTFLQGSGTNKTGASGTDTTINLGIGKRYLSNDKQSVFGINAFYDTQLNVGHKRASLGLEYKRDNFSLNYNKYIPVTDQKVVGIYKEDVMPGYDLRLSGQIPYAPWAKVNAHKYKWDSVVGSDGERSGNVIGVDLKLSKSLTLEMDRDFGRGVSSVRMNFRLPVGETEPRTNFRLSKNAFEKSNRMNLAGLPYVSRENEIKIHKTLNGNTVEIGVFNSTTEGATCSLKTDDGEAVVDIHGVAVEGKTNPEGVVRFENVLIPEGIVVASCVGGVYLDEAGQGTPTAPDLHAVSISELNSDLQIYVTPISEISHQIANEDGNLDDIVAKTAMVEDAFGLEPSELNRVKPDDMNRVTARDGKESNYGMVLAAVSQISKTSGKNATDVIQELVSDIKTTGRLPANKITTAIRELSENDSAPASDSLKTAKGIEILKKIQDKIPEVKKVIISSNITEISEGQTGTYFVKITTEPKDNVKIKISSEADLYFNPSTLILTKENWWKKDNRVDIMANHDANADDANVVITHEVVGEGEDYEYGDVISIETLSILISDDDIANILVSAISGDTSEAGTTATFTIVLTSEPTADVTIPVSSSDITEGTLSASEIKFTPSNWDTPQTVTITGVDDEVQDGNIAYNSIIAKSVSEDGNYNDVSNDRISLNNTDNDTANIVVSAISGNTSEAGTIATFTIVLTSEPTANVTIPVSSSDITEGTLSASEIKFTPSNWDTPQIVTITGVDDDVQDGNIVYNILISTATSNDSNFSVIPGKNRATTSIDNDTANILVSAISGDTSEAGTTATFTIVLTSEPTADVTIPVSSSDTTEGTLSVSEIKFTPANWSTAQTITITGVDDEVQDGNIAYNVLIDSATSSDANFSTIAATNRATTSIDNDTANILVSEISGDTSEAGTTATFTIVLTSEPTADVTIPVSSSDITEGTLSVSEIKFTPANWDTPQTVTITGVDDSDLDGDVSFDVIFNNTITSDTNYTSKIINPVSLKNLNDDFQISLLNLKAKIAANEDVTLEDTSGITDMSKLFYYNGTFNQDISGWDVSNVTNMYRMFTGAGDFNQDISQWDVGSVTNMSGLFDGASAFSQDIGGWSVGSVTDMSNMLRSMHSFNQDISGWDTSNVTDMGSMFYSNYSFNQDISEWDVSGVTWSGQDSFNINAILKCYNTPVFTGTTRIGCYPPEIITSGVSGTTSESGTTATITVVLASEPRHTVTIPVSSSDTTEGTVSTNSLVFTTTDWNQTRTITVTGVDDTEFDGNVSYNIIMGASISTDADYSGQTNNVAVINTNYELPETNQSLRDRVANNEDVSGANTSQVTDMGSLFQSKSTFNQDISGWDTSSVTDMSYMFTQAYAFNQDISGWDVSNVTNMSGMFRNASAFNKPIGTSWDTSSVTNMYDMFGMNGGFNQDISGWDVSNVTDMSYMFNYASQYNNGGSSLGAWNTSSLTNAESMFKSASKFNQSISNWNVSQITIAKNMFDSASIFNQDLSGWDVSSWTSFRLLFSNATAFNGDVTGWNTANATDMGYMFQYAKVFNQDISGWNTSNVTNMNSMFKGNWVNTTTFNQDIGLWNVSSVTDMNSMFKDNNAFNQNIGNWNTSAVMNMSDMFNGASTFAHNISGWDVSNVTSSATFRTSSSLICDNTPLLPEASTGCTLPPSTATVTRAELDVMIANGVDVTQVDTSQITDMRDLFKNNNSFNQDISNWNVSNVTTMNSMFSNTYDTFNQDISGWDVSSVTNMYGIFYNARAFNQDISAWNISNVTNLAYAFRDAWAFNQDISVWNTDKVIYMSNMFQDALVFNQDISGWNVGLVTSTLNFSVNSPLTCVNTPVFNTPICTPPPSTATVTKAELITMIANGDDVTQVDTGQITDMSSLFYWKTTFNQDISAWDVSSVTNMKQMFDNARDFNQNISSWDVSNVTNMELMFGSAYDFNQDISGWNTGNVSSMKKMFYEAYSFNSPVNSWDVSNVTTMNFMFFNTLNFNKPLDAWVTSNVTDMAGMLRSSTYFNQDISSWDVSNVTNMDQMFYYATNFNYNISGWDVSNVISTTDFNTSTTLICDNTPIFNPPICTPPPTSFVTRDELIAMIANGTDVTQADTSLITNMDQLFKGISNFNQDLSGWDVSNVTSMSLMFREASGFSGNVSNWDVSNVTNLSVLFSYASGFTSDVSGWNTSNVTNMSNLAGFGNFNQDISNWDVSNVTTLDSAFRYNGTFNQDISAWDTGSVTQFSSLFDNASAFNQDISGWDISSTLYSSSFRNSSGLTCDNTPRLPQSSTGCVLKVLPATKSELINYLNNGEDPINIDTSLITDMSGLFQNNPSFNGDLSAWKTSSVTNMSNMFNGASSFNQDIASWNTSSVTNMSNMFNGASLFSQNLTTWNISNVTASTSFNTASALTCGQLPSLPIASTGCVAPVEIFSHSGDMGNSNWFEKTWTTTSGYQSTPFRLYFHYVSANTDTGWQGDLAVDFVKLGNTVIGDDFGSEGWQQVGVSQNISSLTSAASSSSSSWSSIATDSGNGNWLVMSGATGSGNTGPSIAHNGNYYIYAEASTPGFPSKNFWTRSPVITGNGTPQTISAFLNAYGSQIGTLRVYVVSE